jgi:hypothetical protein
MAVMKYGTAVTLTDLKRERAKLMAEIRKAQRRS